MNDTGNGIVPADDGWFVVNLADTPAMRHEDFGSGIIFEPHPGHFPHFGINVRWLEPGQPASIYHAESAQEAFLILLGEATLLVEDSERPVKQWDFVHIPPDVPHAVVGAGDRPCAVLMVGARLGEEHAITFPQSDAAVRHGASAPEGAITRDQAYAGRGELEPRESFWPPPA
jgi:uncharacterized cupin superfamily protein